MPLWLWWRECRHDQARRRLPLRPGRARRGHAPPRPRRRPHPHRRARFRVWEGGGEYNVARGLRRCFGLRTAIVTAFADNPVGRLLEDLILPGRRRPAATSAGCPTTASGASVAQRAQLHRARLRRPRGGRLLRPRPHRGRRAAAGRHRLGRDLRRRGRPLVPLPAASSRRSRRRPPALRARRCRRRSRHGTIVSFDLNYRASLWKAIGGPGSGAGGEPRARRARRRLLGNEEDFTRRSASRSRASTRPRTLDLDISATMHRRGARRLPEPPRRRHDPARGAHRHRQRLGRRLLHARRRSSSGPRCAGSRSSTASAAATRSPPD